MAPKTIPEFPQVYFNSKWPAILGKLIAKKSWNGVTVPDGFTLPPVDSGQFVYPKGLEIYAGQGIPAGCHFDCKKEKVEKEMPGHELFHWTQYRAQGIVFYLVNLAYQYKVYGYDNAPVEKKARAAGKKGLDTPQKLSWWDKA